MVAALKRYDSGLRVRWSPEKRCWAVDAPYSVPNPNVIPKPVKFYRIGNADHWVETLLPENSERNIQYRDKRYVVCWAKKITMALFNAIARRDSHRYGKGAVGLFDAELAKQDAKKSADTKRRKDERIYAGWDRFKFDLRRNPNAEDGTGVSIKGMNLEAA